MTVKQKQKLSNLDPGPAVACHVLLAYLLHDVRAVSIAHEQNLRSPRLPDTKKEFCQTLSCINDMPTPGYRGPNMCKKENGSIPPLILTTATLV